VLNREIISTSLPTLNLHDTILQALEMMNEFHVSQLPVVDNDKYLGLVFEEDLMSVDENATLQAVTDRFSKVAVRASSHFIEAIQTANDYHLSVVPVIEKEMNMPG
jgi:CBS domain-containing protein